MRRKRGTHTTKDYTPTNSHTDVGPARRAGPKQLLLEGREQVFCALIRNRAICSGSAGMRGAPPAPDGFEGLGGGVSHLGCGMCHRRRGSGRSRGAFASASIWRVCVVSWMARCVVADPILASVVSSKAPDAVGGGRGFEEGLLAQAAAFGP